MPQVRYARANDGVAIAYTTIGDGAVPIVVAAPLIGQLEIAWEDSAFEAFISRLAVGGTVVLYDRRGSGLSDRGSESAAQLGLPQLANDIEAVLDDARLERAAVLGISLGASSAVQFVATHPDRSSALVTFGGAARLTHDSDFDLGLDPADAEAWIERAVAVWGTGASVEADGPTMAGDDRYRAWAARLERHTISPGGFAATLRAAFGYDTRPLLSRVTAPTLVIHRRDDQAVPVAQGRYLASHLPNANFVELPGTEHTYFLGDQHLLLNTIRSFLDQHVAGGRLRTAVRRAERRSAYGSGWDALTPREQQVAALAAQGLTNTEIAERMQTSPYTVDGRLRRVFAKLNVSSRVELTTQYTRRSP